MCEEAISPSAIGRAWMEGDASALRGRFLCWGHAPPPRRKPHPPMPPAPPSSHLTPGTPGWRPQSWRTAIKEHEDSLRQYEADHVHATSVSERSRSAAAARALQPQLTLRDIRRYRLPLVKSLPLDLEDDGFPMTASIIEGLVHYNEQMQKVAPKGSAFHEEPPLSQRPQLLLKMAAGVSEVEAAGQMDPPRRAEQIDRLMELAAELLGGGETLFWAVEKLLLIACDVAATHPLDGYRREAQARYAYGHFLHHIGQLAPAVEQLERARCLSLSKEWVVSGGGGESQAGNPAPGQPGSPLCESVVWLQARCLLGLARAARPSSPTRAVRLCSRGLRRLGAPALAAVEAELLLELGLSYKEQHNYPLARTALAMYLEEFDSVVPPEGRCLALLEAARCLSQLGETRAAQEYLLKVLELAKGWELKELTALALQCMGEGFMSIRYFRTASECLAKAFELYRQMEQQDEVEKLRVLAAISKGTEVLPYLSLLINSTLEDTTDFSMDSLLAWRLHRTPFWRQRGRAVEGEAPKDDQYGEGPRLPRPHLYTTVQVKEEPPHVDDVKELEQARMMVEDALEAAREEANARSAALRLMREERLKTGVRINVFHPLFNFPSTISDLSELSEQIMPESPASITDLVRRRNTMLSPEEKERQEDMMRNTEMLLEDLLRAAKEGAERGEGENDDEGAGAGGERRARPERGKRAERGARADRGEEAGELELSPSQLFPQQSQPTLRDAEDTEGAFGKVTSKAPRKALHGKKTPAAAGPVFSGAASAPRAMGGAASHGTLPGSSMEESVDTGDENAASNAAVAAFPPVPAGGTSASAHPSSARFHITPASSRFPITPIPEHQAITSVSQPYYSTPNPEGEAYSQFHDWRPSNSTTDDYPTTPTSDNQSSTGPEGYSSPSYFHSQTSPPIPFEYTTTSTPNVINERHSSLQLPGNHSLKVISGNQTLHTVYEEWHSSAIPGGPSPARATRSGRHLHVEPDSPYEPPGSMGSIGGPGPLHASGTLHASGPLDPSDPLDGPGPLDAPGPRRSDGPEGTR